jgi:galactokinase
MAKPRDRDLLTAFEHAHGHCASGLVRAPGRVNLIGEHTDYNDGFCLPMAIDRDMRIAWSTRDDQTVCVSDVGLPDTGVVSFELSTTIAKNPELDWLDYLKGCAQILAQAGVPLRGCDLTLSGNVPLGSGLSSSAALEVATIHALLAAAEQQLDPIRIAQLAQQAENHYVGTNCGILDQLASACCQAGSAALMDCRDLSLTPVPLPSDVTIMIADTGKRRGLVDSAYNLRRRQCEAGAQALQTSHLRNVDLHSLATARDGNHLDPEAFRRCAYVVAENGRAQAAASCLRAGDATALGALMDQSHAGLRDDFEVTCPELDRMTAIARSLPGCLGSRMTGAGFGGCTVSLVTIEKAAAFQQQLLERYQQEFPQHQAAVYQTGAAAGAGPLPL